jgi:hypothetical protein
MRRAFLLLILALVVPMAAPAMAHPAAGSCSGRICLQARATPGCLRPQVWGIIHRLAARVGPVEVTSTCHGRHARNSLHYSGRAADIRALATSQRTAVAVLRDDPGVGGLIAEGRGLIHVDLGRGSFDGVRRFASSRPHRHFASRHHRHRHYAYQRPAMEPSWW